VADSSGVSSRLHGRGHQLPIDLLYGIDRRRNIRAEFEETKHLLRFEADVGVDKQEVG